MTAPEDDRRRPGLLTKLALASGSLVVFAVVLEVLFHLLIPVVYRPRFTRVDDVVGWSHTPGVSALQELEGHEYVVTYNRHGYRWPDRPLAKPEGVRRVVVLGDSFVDGGEVGDRETFTWLLDERLPDTEVINMGVYGYSTAQELVTLEHRGLAFEPDLVVMVTILNDLYGNNSNFDFFGPAPRYVMDGDSLRFEGTQSAPAQESFRRSNLPIPGLRFFHRHSYLYYLVNAKIYQRLSTPRLGDMIDEQLHALSEPEREELYRRLVMRMKALTDAAGAELLVVLAYEPGPLGRPDGSPHARVARTLAAEGVRIVDLYDDLSRREADGPGSLYYETDFHWNVVGHRFIADRLHPLIEELLDESEAR